MDRFEVVVIGAGPAGLSAALVAHGNGLCVLVLEAAAEIGGQVHLADHPIGDLLGTEAASGRELVARFARQASSQTLPVRTNSPVVAVRRGAMGFAIELAHGEPIVAEAVVLATGARPRKLGVPGEMALGAHDRARPLAHSLRGQHVVIAGSGDEASSTAKQLADAGVRVTMVVRGTAITARPRFAKELLLTEGVQIRYRDEIVELQGEDRLEAVRLASGARLEASRCFIRIGAELVLPPIIPAPERLEDGRVVADELGRTSVPGLFAAGDLVLEPGRRFIAVAAGSGAIVGRAVEAAIGGDTTPTSTQ